MLILTDEPDSLGEHFRDQFFVQYDGEKYLGKGCYSQFDVHPDVVELETIPVDPEYPDLDKWIRYQKEINGEIVLMRYYWDGDGCLEFHFEDGSFIRNNDCKKDYNWEWGKNGYNWE